MYQTYAFLLFANKIQSESASLHSNMIQQDIETKDTNVTDKDFRIAAKI